MSRLDQAIFKAYAKDGRANPSPAVAEVSSRPLAKVGATGGARAIDQIYHEGGLYRVEAQPIGSQQRGAVPAPHLSMLPPTSPRRAVRRSMLRMFSSHSGAANAEAASEPPPRIARKVIIRHISHKAAPPPLGILRSGRDNGPGEAELPPETITSEPGPSAPNHPSPIAPQTAPLNLAVDAIQSIEVRGNWDHEAAVSPMILVADVRPSDATSMLVNVQLQSLDIQDREAPQPRYRFDGPHAHDGSRPHARFGRSGGSPRPSESPEASEVAPAELTFAEAPLETSAEASPNGSIAPTTQPAGDNTTLKTTEPAKAAVPLWEIDRFHWPRTCEKLFSDENGYLAKAGEKLQAALQDGLKVLAVTGSRRGEGRSTLALCLARAAAKAGIQTAVMDADFARPQLASKVGLEIAHGWQEAALGKIPLSEAAVKSVADQITLLPLESSAATRALSLADPRVAATIRAAAATFELLILDLGPLGAGLEIAFPPGEGCPLDAAIVVRDLRFATVAESEAIGHALQDAGVEAVGIAENYVIDDDAV